MFQGSKCFLLHVSTILLSLGSVHRYRNILHIDVTRRNQCTYYLKLMYNFKFAMLQLPFLEIDDYLETVILYAPKIAIRYRQVFGK